ncbi:MAG: hypothetical protein ACRC7G_13600 [Beijerinckiaceae bacterium]
MDKPDDAPPHDRRARRPLRPLLLSIGALLLVGGVLLDLNRVNGVRETLNRVAEIAAIEAAASPRATERQRICQRRFDKHVWTETEVTVDELAVTVEGDREGRTSTVEYDATVKLVVGRYFGLPEISISGEAEVPAPNRHVAAAAP